MPWRPGQQRLHELETPYEDLPAHLYGHVRHWIENRLGSSSHLTQIVVLRQRLEVPPVRRNHGHVIGILMTASADPNDTLDLLELILEQGPADASVELENILEQGYSAYRVRDDARGLEMRVLPEVLEQVQAVVDTVALAPGEHLAAAYNAAYGRVPDTERAYDRAIKAVEAALRPVISPRDSKATLTKMILALRDAPQRWEFALVDERDCPPPNAAGADGVALVLDAMRVLAYGQRQRHGQDGPVENNTDQQARAAVMIAMTLVQWANLGAFRPVRGD